MREKESATEVEREGGRESGGGGESHTETQRERGSMG